MGCAAGVGWAFSLGAGAWVGGTVADAGGATRVLPDGSWTVGTGMLWALREVTMLVACCLSASAYMARAESEESDSFRH